MTKYVGMMLDIMHGRQIIIFCVLIITYFVVVMIDENFIQSDLTNLYSFLMPFYPLTLQF